ncbi:MAG: metal ABC transporter ATP-binding protein [Thermodesulfobacteriota bacterium]
MQGSRCTAGATVTFADVNVARAGVQVLDRVSATVPQGGCTAIVGPNGAGKTTLLLALLGQIPFQGLARIEGLRSRRPRLGYVPQRLSLDHGLPLSVMELMLMEHQRLPLWLGRRKRHQERARALLAEVRAEGLVARRVGALSGGELQRVLLALALAQEPDLLVLDEPTAGVDVQGDHVLCDLLERLRCERGFTQLMVSHDLATVTHHATHVIALNHRVVAEGPPHEVLTSTTLTSLFGLHMGLVDRRAMPGGGTSCSASCCQRETDA